MKKKYKWGILAPGKMAAKFAGGLKQLQNAELYAVGSRDRSKAEKFARDYGFKKFYGSYAELAEDPEVEIIYVASPHSFHHEHSILCLGNGKAVLCEKAFAMNSREVEDMISESKRNNAFLMEALWPPFQPYYKKASEIMRAEVTGKILFIRSYFSFIPPFDPEDRKFNIVLGGSSLLDIGIYPVIDTLAFAGVPEGVKAFAAFGKTGSEESVSAVFSYSDGTLASIFSSFRTNGGIGCEIFCEKGKLTLSRGRDMNQRILLELDGMERETLVFSPPALGYHWVAEEVMNCLDNGLIESPVIPLSFSLDLIRTLDRIRKEAEIKFPADLAGR